MLINTDEIEKLLDALKQNPENQEEIFKTFKLVHAVFEESDGIPPRFGNNFRTEGPQWEKVTGLDFEAIGRVLVCHLTIEHYLNNLIELSTPEILDWDSSKMTFSQKLKLVSKINILADNKFIKGIEILNSIRNKLSHKMLATIDENKIKELKTLLLEYLSKEKTNEQKDKIETHINLFGTYAIIEKFTQMTCAIIAGYCTSLIKKEADGASYYKYVRTPTK